MNDLTDVIVIDSKDDLIRYFGNDHSMQLYPESYHVVGGPGAIMIYMENGFCVSFLDPDIEDIPKPLWQKDGF